MINLSHIGRIFYGVSILALGALTIYYNEFSYMLIPPVHVGVPGLTYVAGALFAAAGILILIEKNARQVALLLGGLFLLIFVFFHLPYQLFVSKNHLLLGDWENSLKELAFAGGAFLVAGLYPATDNNGLMRFLAKLIPCGAIFFAIPVLSFGILHFMVTKQASMLVPAWIPGPMFWTYLAGVGLLASAIAMILKIWVKHAATLLGIIILIWFVILHIPRIFVAPAIYMDGEITSALLALAYSGIAFLVAGKAKS